MNIDRRRFLKGAGAAGMAGAASMAGMGAVPRNASAANLDPAESYNNSNLARFAGNVVVKPGKYSGLVQVVDLGTSETLAWLPMMLTGIDAPIPHHICAMPSKNPRETFDFFFTMQRPGSPYINENSPEWRDRGHMGMWKARYDGRGEQNRIILVNDVADTTGMGLGVHAALGVGPNQGLVSYADGQKDLVLVTTTDDQPKIVASFKFDYDPVAKTLNCSRVFPDPSTGKFDYQGLRGMKITHEALMGEELMPADPTACFIDTLVWHPELPVAAILIRRLGLVVIVDTETWEPVTVIATPKGAPDHFPLVRQTGYTWAFSVPSVLSPMHEAGFLTNGKYLFCCNNVLQNNVGVVDSSHHDPRKWKKIAYIEGFGRTHLPFHTGNMQDSRYIFFTAWARRPNRGYIVRCTPGNWTLDAKIDIGPDPHTVDVLHDDEHISAVYSGHQGGQSGLVIINADSLEIVARMPSPNGHHDHVVIPSDWQMAKASRSVSV